MCWRGTLCLPRSVVGGRRVCYATERTRPRGDACARGAAVKQGAWFSAVTAAVAATFAAAFAATFAADAAAAALDTPFGGRWKAREPHLGQLLARL